MKKRGFDKPGAGKIPAGGRGQGSPLQRDRAEKSLLLEGRDALSKRAGGTFAAKAGSNL